MYSASRASGIEECFKKYQHFVYPVRFCFQHGKQKISFFRSIHEPYDKDT